MKQQSASIYSLSVKLKALNPNLTTDISIVDIANLSDTLENTPPSSIIFEQQQITDVLQLVNLPHITKNRFICISNSLSSDERLLLLNNNIEFMTPEKFTKADLCFFEVRAEQSNYKVLLIEDDADQIAIIEHILQSANITIKSITKGELILETLDSFCPDLILIDLYLEGITADKLIKVVRKKYKYQFLPIVCLTADPSIDSRIKVLNAGADDLLTKPIDAELLVSALKSRMQRHYTPEPQTNLADTAADNIESKYQQLNAFIEKNTDNELASIIWLKLKNKQSLQKKLGYEGFINFSKNIFSSLPLSDQKFDVKIELAAGIFTLASHTLSRTQAKDLVEKIQQWLAANSFVIQNTKHSVDIVAVILADIPAKSEKHSLLNKAENILIDTMTDKGITFLAEEVEERHFHLIKTQLEHSIKTRNFKWQYQTIISTQDETQEIYQLMLQIITESGKELSGSDYLEVASKTGLIMVLDRFTLEHAIRIIRAGEQKNIYSRTLLNQVFSDYQSRDLRTKKLATITKLNLPIGSMIFQFSQNEAVENISILGEIASELKQAKIKVCLSDFDFTKAAWNIARKFNVGWIRLKPFDKHSPILDSDNPDSLQKIIRKAHVLGYKVIVTRVDSAGFAADLWKLDVDYLQGNFIQTPVRDIFSD